jgi:hypothetical protein
MCVLGALSQKAIFGTFLVFWEESMPFLPNKNRKRSAACSQYFLPCAYYVCVANRMYYEIKEGGNRPYPEQVYLALRKAGKLSKKTTPVCIVCQRTASD